MRLIDADALIQDIREHSASYFADDFAHEWVDKQPTIEPQRIGKWIVYYECPKCGEITKDFTEYCPFCSADMRGEKDE